MIKVVTEAWRFMIRSSRSPRLNSAESQPVLWIAQTAGLDVVLKVREVSRAGLALLVMVFILLVVVRTTSSIADRKNELARQLIGKTDAWYIATGEVDEASCVSAVGSFLCSSGF